MSEAYENGLSLKDIIQKASEGNEEAFNALVKEFTPHLRKIISSYNIPASEVDDAVQEGLIGLNRAVELYDSELSGFSTFAYICMKSNVLSWLRKGKKGMEIPFESDVLLKTCSPEIEPEKKVIGEENKDSILKKIENELSPFEMKVLLFSVAGDTSEEIAKKIGKPKKSVENALFRSRDKVKNIIKV